MNRGFKRERASSEISRPPDGDSLGIYRRTR
jgi:hypothetical protein